MTASEVIEFVNRKKDGILASVKASGKPHVSWVLLAYLDCRLYTTQSPLSVAYRNLLERPRVAIAITVSSTGVFIEGRARSLGTADKLRSTGLARIEVWSEAHRRTGRWLPSDYEGYVFEITIQRILTYNPT